MTNATCPETPHLRRNLPGYLIFAAPDQAIPVARAYLTGARCLDCDACCAAALRILIGATT